MKKEKSEEKKKRINKRKGEGEGEEGMRRNNNATMPTMIPT